MSREIRPEGVAELRGLIARWFPDPFGGDDDGSEATWRVEILKMLLAGESAAALGRRFGSEPAELAQLRALDEAAERIRR